MHVEILKLVSISKFICGIVLLSYQRSSEGGKTILWKKYDDEKEVSDWEGRCRGSEYCYD